MIVLKRKVHYYETDQMKVVHHSNYIRWFEEARTLYFVEAGMPYSVLEEKGIICPVLSVSAQYRSMTEFEDEVEISCMLRKFSGVKLEFYYEVKDAATGELRTTGTSEHTFVGENHKLISLKKVAPEAYNILMERVEA